VMVFRARISTHGGGKYIISVPKALARKAEELYRARREVVVIVLEVENPRRL